MLMVVQLPGKVICNPSSSFRVPPDRSMGPPSPDATEASTLSTQHNASEELEKGYQRMLENGFDPLSFWEQRIAWGDQDSYQYVPADGPYE